jgi:hypothetical protein
LLRDDGAVVYLNEVEVFRSNMPTNGPITFATLASSNVGGGDETTNYFSTLVNPGLLRVGTNLLAVEIHQSGPTSSDISFELELLGLRPPLPPALVVQRSETNTFLSWTAFAQDFRLESSVALGQSNWSAATNSIVLINASNRVAVGSNSAGFYRLKKP